MTTTPTATADRLLTPSEVAQTLRVCRASVYSGTLRHQLPWRRIGTRQLRLSQYDLDRYLSAALNR